MKELSKKRERKIFLKNDKKETLAIFKEYFDLQKTKRNMVPIIPYKKGYDRTLALRDDVAKRDDAHRILEALNFCRNKDWSRNKDFTTKNRKTKKIEKVNLNPKAIHKKDFLKKVPEHLYKFFTLTYENSKHIYKHADINTGRWVYIWKDRYLLKYVITPHYVTHAYIEDPNITSRRTELSNYIYNNNLWQKYYKYLSKTHRREYEDETYKLLEKAVKKDIKLELLN